MLIIYPPTPSGLTLKGVFVFSFIFIVAIRRELSEDR